MTDFSSGLTARMRGFVFVIFAAALAMLMTSGTSIASPAPAPGTPVFASVDMSKIIANYGKRATADQVFQTLQQQYEDVYKTQAANPMLAEADLQKLGTLLLLGDSATADQKQQISDLETQGNKASQDLADLQQKKDATDADKIQLQQLTAQQQAGQQALQDIGDNYKQVLDQKNQQMSQDIASDIRTAVAGVAKQQGITVVFDSSVAIYASIDLTQAVITKLGGTK